MPYTMYATISIMGFCSITTALTCHGQLRQAPWTWVKRWRHHDLVSTRVTELHRWRSRSVWLVMRHRTNWCQLPSTPYALHDSLRRRDICAEAPTPNSVTCITVTAMCTTCILSAEYLTRFCAFQAQIFTERQPPGISNEFSALFGRRWRSKPKFNYADVALLLQNVNLSLFCISRTLQDISYERWGIDIDHRLAN